MDINACNIATHSADAPATAESVPIVGRFAPSPSGRMHLGNVFSCLCSWLSARSQGGRITLRIEDLDDRCKRPELAAQLINDLAWLGLEWDEGPYYQHDRLDLYESALHQLQDAGLTYPCFCTRAELHAASAPHASDGTPIYRGACRGLSAEEVARRSILRAPATRLRVPAVDDLADDVVEFVDRTYGAQCEALATECGDFLVRRSDGVFAYQLAVVVDDAAMGVTEIVRGCDLLGSTPRQIYLQHLLGLPTPRYAHIPLLMSPDGRRLSKRDRDLDLGELRTRFGTPEALLGWLAGQTGIAPDTTPRSAEQLVEHFRWDVIRAHRENITVTVE
ncbi:tRNA glutamyl-Q(34) synthetase GluQRS [Collinsella aerofaciens]|uniref:tRNA glutamyl-Q(34) synthetase GluQRS n=1 Tax=Collinsella aerofaciens TaxID=74426 RepID=UPI001105C57B|nr:tRNA glutamyl-Q(34) synthetase GluQRS [Collinsella aerofaciens]MDB1875398.1 tRNA glutamyl-Q(34) synthetase GluQRS [Collinsella aerofaciens]MDB1878409.1 tRNA glutamyl-Q(34) synthetase GluQRS [Collinsella aerofaciens]